MATTEETAARLFEALNARDLDAAAACWTPGSIDRVAGQRELVAPDGVRAYFAELFDAFPDFRFEIIDMTTRDDRCAVRWRARGTFAGPGRFQGFTYNGSRVEFEGCDVMSVTAGSITHNDAYFDSGDVARQLGLLPAAGSTQEARLAKLANAATRARRGAAGAELEAIAAGVWIVRGGHLRTMNVYLLACEGGVTVFDAGISVMRDVLAAACARLGGVRRVVLGHADADHRGAAGGLRAPIYCHPAEREAAQLPSSFRDYWDLSKLAPWARPLYPSLLRAWDGGAVPIAGTVEEGEEIAGFKVVHLPGHAPGLIGLFREEDRLALVSDCIYTLDPETGVKGRARVPHPAFNLDGEQARDSIRKLAALRPSVVWAGHANAVAGEVSDKLLRAAAARD
jgi:glyoxylase-like metal-dependent hydrolase (beta-lactamase superfamily II)/predicted ester cyclase